MIAPWMLYAAVIGALLAIAALALERVAAVLRIPTRFVWLASIVASMLWPIIGPAMRLAPHGAGAPLIPFTIVLAPTRVIAGAGFGARWAALIDPAMIGLWIALSIALIARLYLAVGVLRRARREWRPANVDGTPVRLSANVGPAVVGLRSMDVVLPEWIMSLDAPLRALVLRHEEEHRATRDPYLLLIAAVAVAAMPWNLALWLQARRLRLALEVDCDARVLRAYPSPERYGLLMLTIAQRRSVVPMFAPMLSEPTSQLERRIIAMRSIPKNIGRITAVAGTAIAMSVLVFACSLRSDGPVAPTRDLVLGRPQPVNDNQTYFEFQVEKTVTPVAGGPRVRYPTVLRTANVEGEVLAQFVVDTLGLADMSTFKVLKSSHDLFTESVRAALPMMRFHPAEVGGRKVKQLVQMPYEFSLSK
jgi:beta-lactamase regulating signal transducer with metallopeptidase domain